MEIKYMNDFETQHVAITRADGGISLMQIVTNAPLNGFSTDAAEENGFVLGDNRWVREVTDAMIVAHIVKARIDATSWQRVNPDELPSDRTFRGAWVHDRQKGVSVDMPKARDIGHAMRRAKRESELAPLDKEMNINLTSPTKLAEIEAGRRAVRDNYAAMQVEIDAADTPAEILSVIAV